MFRKGDKVVCIWDSRRENEIGIFSHKIYEVTSVIYNSKGNNVFKVNNIDWWVSSSNFISLKEYRKNKINKIYESVC